MSILFKLAASTAVAGALAVGAAAQGTTPGAATSYVTSPGVGDVFASNLIGVEVVTPDVESDRPAWNAIGEVEDVLIGDSGEVRAILVDVGGFLGIGAKTVALPMSGVDIGREHDGAPLRLSVDQSREALESAPTFEYGAAEWALDERARGAGETLGAAASDAGEAIEEGATSIGSALSEGADSMGSAIDQDSDELGARSDEPRDERITGAATTDDAPTATEMQAVAGASVAMSPEELEGVDVLDASNDSVGSVAEVVSGPRGEMAVLSIGGILGLGAHRVALPLDQLDVARDAASDEVTVRVDATVEELREMPAYDG